jgi:hypothetical protein
MRLFASALTVVSLSLPGVSHAQEAPAAPAQAPATPDGCYPGKENGEDVLFCPKPTAAQAPSANGSPAQGPVQMTTEWYGWQTLAADGASLALFVGGVGTTAARSSGTSSALLLGSLAVYSLGGPIIHFAHNRPGAALGSFGLRWGMPTVGTLLGVSFAYASCGKSNDNGVCYGVYGLLGLTVGTIGAIVVDSALLAREQVQVKFTAAKNFTWRPDLNVSPSSVSAGLSGAF